MPTTPEYDVQNNAQNVATGRMSVRTLPSQVFKKKSVAALRLVANRSCKSFAAEDQCPVC